jgi:site-specific DNA-methyltransferase (adenine-specific)
MDLKKLRNHSNYYYSTDNGVLLHGDCLTIMPKLEPVDLIVTSPPYDNIRDYEGYSFDFKKISGRLWDVIKDGGVLVWVVKDAFIDGSETGTSFKQALHFKEIGFNLTTMLYIKNTGVRTGSLNFYQDNFEYVFILTKGNDHTFNPIKDKINTQKGKTTTSSKREKDGTLKKFTSTTAEVGQRDNVWKYEVGYQKSAKDKIAYQHPAIFPEALAQDHIISWSNEGDIVLDPMAGSGTVPKVCERLNRRWLACEISEKYCEIAAKRIEREAQQLKLFAVEPPDTPDTMCR